MSGDEDGKLPYRLHLEEKEEEDGDGGELCDGAVTFKSCAHQHHSQRKRCIRGREDRPVQYARASEKDVQYAA